MKRLFRLFLPLVSFFMDTEKKRKRKRKQEGFVFFLLYVSRKHSSCSYFASLGNAFFSLFQSFFFLWSCHCVSLFIVEASFFLLFVHWFKLLFFSFFFFFSLCLLVLPSRRNGLLLLVYKRIQDTLWIFIQEGIISSFTWVCFFLTHSRECAIQRLS